MSEREDHVPLGNPCKKCGKGPNKHRVYHKFQASMAIGKPCIHCGLPEYKHRARPERERSIQYIGIDGEGQGRKPHRYVLLAASDQTGNQKWYVENTKGLSTEQCLELILGLPTRRTKIFSYSFNYDLTKILEDVDDPSLYVLFRPEMRPGPKGPVPVKWNGYSLNLQGTKFTLRKEDKKVVIWDLFKFYQSKFVESLKLWKVGNKEAWDRMTLMKDKRSEFDKESMDSVRAYCFEECKYIAELAKKLIDSHDRAKLQLRSYYGAGSSGAAMLTAMKIKDKIKQPPEEMKVPTAGGFFGGRFENSVIGEIKGTLYDYDISSAYPYQLTFLPCLLHGNWELTHRRKDLETTKAALVHYGLGPNPGISDWGPFPFRSDDGSISFPIESGGGWVWLAEYLAGEKHFPHVHFKEAWVYHGDCKCQPFKKIPEYYIQRLILGKEGPGIVIKLGCNSCYGKLAQSVGNAIFNSWIWAGMITSGTRAQILDVIALHKNRSNVLTIATDGIKTREKIITPVPIDTGTGAMGKPLGGWEEKQVDKGLFVARPGIYFPLEPTTEELKEIRGRGVGKGVVLENWARILDAWKTNGLEGIASVANVSRFCGAKTSISYAPKTQEFTRARSKGNEPSYGEWITRKVELSFHPMPKRESINADGLTLKLRTFPKHLESTPYERAIHGRSKDALEMKAATQELLEQPDADLSDFEVS